MNAESAHPPATEEQDPWTLAGSLAAFGPNAVLSILNLQQVTGELRLEYQDMTAAILLQQGEVIDARLGHDRGIAALFYLLTCPAGRFWFVPGPVPAGERTITLTLPVLQVRAALWQERWKQVDQVFPSVWHRVSLHPQPAGAVTVQAHQWPVLAQVIARPSSLVRLAGLLHQDLMPVAQTAADLVRLGLATVLPPGGEDTAASCPAEIGPPLPGADPGAG